MARMHSRARGKSKSSKPLVSSAKQWVNYSADEIEKLVEKIGKTGARSAKVGRVLRDSYGIPSVKDLAKKKLNAVLKKTQKQELPEDLFNLLKRAVKAKKHLEKNKKDVGSDHGFRLIESKIKRLVKYYKSKKVLEHSWVYSIEKAKLLVE
ncbi:MAG: 30S ribosomal protein S15 [Candidatus Nanoarchaeia archaeon]|nr:30S ribosomal protein S15 [Candidatus Nanoarchaeia archaeon]MDD5054489.1 30S ribosomal protein S15 [Candidatus Nanoarchaeia archaeon]MDD5499912.1 30S ribosomal protein S15 [Candidatus Nanoarchaeia archaeon]